MLCASDRPMTRILPAAKMSSSVSPEVMLGVEGLEKAEPNLEKACAIDCMPCRDCNLATLDWPPVGRNFTPLFGPRAAFLASYVAAGTNRSQLYYVCHVHHLWESRVAVGTVNISSASSENNTCTARHARKGGLANSS